jgi:hypothetical protein
MKLKLVPPSNLIKKKWRENFGGKKWRENFGGEKMAGKKNSDIFSLFISRLMRESEIYDM